MNVRQPPKELRCPVCNRKIAEANARGELAGKFKCRKCKAEAEIFMPSGPLVRKKEGENSPRAQILLEVW